MEDKRADVRYKSFMDIKVKDPINQCYQFQVSLRKKRFRERTYAKRLLLKQQNNTSKNNSQCRKWLENDAGKLQQEAHRIGRAAIENDKYNAIGELLENIKNSQDQSLLKQLYILKDLLMVKNIQFGKDQIEYLIDVIQETLDTNIQDADIVYE